MESFISVAAAGAALSANGNAAGYVTVASIAGFYPGAFAWLSDNTGKSQRCRITGLTIGGVANTIGLRFVSDLTDQPVTASGQLDGPRYTRSDCSAFLTANSARIDMEPGVVPLQNVSTVVPKDSV